MFCYFFSDEKKGQMYFNSISRIWMKVWLRLIGCSIKINGLEHFKYNENYIVVFNHNALLDVPLSSPFVPGGNKTIAKASFSKVPLFGIFYKRGSVLVDRKNEKSRIKSFDMMKIVLSKGMHMCIYPEGTRNRTESILKPFYDGAFRLSVDTHKKIMPCIIKGTKEAMPINKTFYLLPKKLSMNFLEPVGPDDLNPKELNKIIFEKMRKELKKTNTY